MKLSGKVIKRLLLPVSALLCCILAIGYWWHARTEGRVDLARKLIGRWAAEGQNDSFPPGASMVLSGGAIFQTPNHCCSVPTPTGLSTPGSKG